jgi:hypothetical protein
MTTFEYIRDCVITRIKPSPIHGVGTFAIKDIPKGKNVFTRWEGPTGIYSITKNEFKLLNIEQQNYIMDMFKSIDNIRLCSGMYFVFVLPNCFINFNNKGLGNINGYNGKSLTDIKCNDELYVDFIYDGDKTII